MEEIEVTANFLKISNTDLIRCGEKTSLVRYLYKGNDAYFLCSVIKNCKDTQELIKYIDSVLNTDISRENLYPVEYSINEFKKVRLIYFEDKNSDFENLIDNIILKFKNKNFDEVFFIYKNPYIEKSEITYEIRK